MEKIEETEPKKFRVILKTKNSSLKVLFFHSEETPECEQIEEVLGELISSGDYTDAGFFVVDANKQEEICKAFDVSSVPCIIFEWQNETDRLVGANVPTLVKMMASNYAKSQVAVENDDPEEDLEDRLTKLVNKAPCMLFMKGSPETPKCGFSRQVIELLRKHNAQFETFDILEDNDVRQGLKAYSNWPTYPQFYIKGELIGGIDILKEMSEDGDLDDVLSEI